MESNSKTNLIEPLNIKDNNIYCNKLSQSTLNINDNNENAINKYYKVSKEVYASNLEEELENIKNLIQNEELVYVGMDTEFPGNVHNLNNIKDDFYYRNMKLNVESTKLIQLGITLTNRNGEYLKGRKYNTWQFNFQFDLDTDKYNEKSIDLLKENGMNFEELKKNGINQKRFVSCFIKSGLMFKKNVKWISYQGLYDFGYLLKILTNEKLEENENNFIKRLKLYFPSFYDIKLLIKDIDMYSYGGLNKLIANLGIERKGISHQSGSDSIATVEAFHKLKANKNINCKKLRYFKNALYGIGIGRDNKNTIKYINISKDNINDENIKKKNNYNQFGGNMINKSLNRNNYILYFIPCFLINRS